MGSGIANKAVIVLTAEVGLILNKLTGFARKKDIYRNKLLTREAFYGPSGSLLDGPDGCAIHEFEYDLKGQLINMRNFDQNGAPCSNLGGGITFKRDSKAVWINGTACKNEREGIEALHRTQVPLLHVTEVLNVYTPAAVAGLLPGDDLWSLGNWSSPDVISKAQQDSKQPDDILRLLTLGFFNVTQAAKDTRSRLIIVREGKKLETLLPPLGADGKLGIRIQDHWLPRSAYEQILHEPISFASSEFKRQ